MKPAEPIGMYPSTVHLLAFNQSRLRHQKYRSRLHLHLHDLSQSVRRWADAGLLDCYRIGIRGDRRFLADDVEEFLVAKANGPDVC